MDPPAHLEMACGPVFWCAHTMASRQKKTLNRGEVHFFSGQKTFFLFLGPGMGGLQGSGGIKLRFEAKRGADANPTGRRHRCRRCSAPQHVHDHLVHARRDHLPWGTVGPMDQGSTARPTGLPTRLFGHTVMPGMGEKICGEKK